MAKAEIFSEKARHAGSVLFLNSHQRAAEIVCEALLKLCIYIYSIRPAGNQIRTSYLNAGDDRIHIHSAFIPLFYPQNFDGDAQILSARPFRIPHWFLHAFLLIVNIILLLQGSDRSSSENKKDFSEFLRREQKSRVICRAGCRNCQDLFRLLMATPRKSGLPRHSKPRCQPP